MSLLRSFKYAFQGVWYSLCTQRNMRIHFSLAIMASLFGLVYNLTYIEWIVFFATAFLVIILEMVNTAVENVVDIAVKEYNDHAKIAKDVAAGAVLMSAVFAVMVGALLFLHMERLANAFVVIFNNVYYIAGFCAVGILEFVWICFGNIGKYGVEQGDKYGKK